LNEENTLTYQRDSIVCDGIFIQFLRHSPESESLNSRYYKKGKDGLKKIKAK
jgi:hypothetical protein